MGFSDYDSYDGVGLAELVARGEVSPPELTEEAISRIEALNPALGAVVHTSYDRARQQARGPLPDGPFRGVPFLLKDLHGEDAGQPCTGSCRLLQGYVPDRDSELVRRYKQAGLIILGRTNTPEFGIYAVTESQLRGPCRNPWDLSRTPGGSSGGSAAAVAARMVPMAHGGDGGGSIRIPASHCGLVGLRPTRARNPMGPYVGEGWAGMVSEHVITRSVRDTAAMLDVSCGPDLGAPYQVTPPARPFREEVGADPGRLRVAFTREALFGGETHPDCARAVDQAAALAEELGHHVVEARPDFDRPLLVRAYLLMVAGGTAADVVEAGRKAGREPRPEDFERPTWLFKLIGERLSAAEYLTHRAAIHREARRVAAFFTHHDVLLTPTAALPPVKVGSFALSLPERLLLRLLRAAPAKPLLMKALDALAETALAATPNTMLWNQTGQPAISLPLHWSAEGLPIGTQWVARFGEEATLLRLASQLEQARPWRDRRPPLLSS